MLGLGLGLVFFMIRTWSLERISILVGIMVIFGVKPGARVKV
jgi:hypothetical protein